MSLWNFFSQLCTCFIPNWGLGWVGETAEEIQAWREKVALCSIMLGANAAFLGFGGLIHILSCVDGKKGGTLEEFPYDDDADFGDDLKKLTSHEDPICRALNRVMLAITFIIVVILAVQCLCSLIYLIRLGRWCSKTLLPWDKNANVIVMVPCYNEGKDELNKTIESVRKQVYKKRGNGWYKNKVLLFVADGNVRGRDACGRDNDFETPEYLSQLLGYQRTDSDPMYDCGSTGFVIGNNGKKIAIGNRAKLYSGTHRPPEGIELKYIVIEKCGLENNDSDKGNRGKRDSQIMMSGLLNKIHHNKGGLNDLETAIEADLQGLGFSLRSDNPDTQVKYLMAVDADTKLERESITQMVYSMESKPNTLALCGETQVDNKNDSWVTQMQVFEYYTNHHLKKAFESVFGTVTCLPGCFTMYRLCDEANNPLFAHDDVYQEYAKNDSKVNTLHEKNLYKLGEDRMLTTLLLKRFPNMTLKFVPEAVCYTIVPDKFSVLLSQRRRWVNSTFHNTLYLLRVRLGGICCISMKFIVILDMVGTLILPSTLLYVGIMAYNAIIDKSQLSMITLIVFGFSVAVQLIVPIIKAPTYLWWAMIYYLVGVPVFYFVLPIYSFWRMDDFSWGLTRQAAPDSAANDSAQDTNDSSSTDNEQNV